MPAIACAILLVLMLGLHLLTRRRLRALADEVERQRRLLEVLDARQHGPPPAPAPPKPLTARFTPRGTTRLPDTSPTANARLPDPSPRAVKRLGDPSPPSANPRLAEPSPRVVQRIADASPRSSPALPDAKGGWAPTHKVVFTPDSGRGETWLVMVGAGPAGGKLAMTKAEWSAGVDPAWHCDVSGTWTYRGQRTPQGVRGTVKVEELR